MNPCVKKQFDKLVAIYKMPVWRKEKTMDLWRRLTPKERHRAILYAEAYQECYPNPEMRLGLQTYLSEKAWELELIPEEYYERFLIKKKYSKTAIR